MDATEERSGLLPANSLVPLDAVVCTEELNRRPRRRPNYETENLALVTLAQALADSPQTILQTLADTILDVFQSDSAGISLLTTDDGGKRFYWPAIAGVWKPHIGGGTPRDFGPCGDVLDRNAPLLFIHPERRYAYLQPVAPPVEECLLVPFYVEGKAVGTIWAITHHDRRKFDAEDLRQLQSVGRFASAAYQAWKSIETLNDQIAEREQAEAEIVLLNERLQQSMTEAHHRIKNNLQVITAMTDMSIMDKADAVTADDLRRISRCVQALAGVHDLLTIQARRDGVEALVPVRALIQKLLDLVELAGSEKHIRAQIDEKQLNSKQASCVAIILNELLSNASKHGGDEIDVRFAVADSGSQLNVCDNGTGFPPDFEARKAAQTGLELVMTLAHWDLGGHTTFQNRPDGGACVSVSIP